MTYLAACGVQDDALGQAVGDQAIVMRNPLVGTSCPELDVRFVGNGEPSAKLYISNLPAPQVDLNTLRSAFAGLGLAAEEMKALPSTGSGLSSALVRLNSVEEAAAALRAFSGQSPGALGLQASQQLQSQEVLFRQRRPTGPGVLRGQRPLHLSVIIMPGALVMNRGRSESINLLVHGHLFTADIKRRLAEVGFSWGPLMPRDGDPFESPEDVEGSRFLFRGMPLKPDVTLQAQGVVDGSELRLLRARGAFQRGAQELRSWAGKELNAPRGLLMNPGLPRWQPALARRAPEEFFDAVQRDDPAHFAHLPNLALMKKKRPEIEAVFAV